MINLPEETLDEINDFGHNVEDIVFIGSRDGMYSCSWNEFRLMADRAYDDGYGSAEVARDLVVVFKDGSWLERYEYDGSEGWSRKYKPEAKDSPTKITKLFSEDSNNRLGELNS